MWLSKRGRDRIKIILCGSRDSRGMGRGDSWYGGISALARLENVISGNLSSESQGGGRGSYINSVAEDSVANAGKSLYAKRCSSNQSRRSYATRLHAASGVFTS